ncbi:MAG: Glucosamine-6-phosphate deaminase 1 [Spirochaetes bacterium ADurb.Bin110]|jgi:glucosamine-6-phosphate deaminase|nr:MAG: Glucosamine-6-phosphate deaminase 1 [Spirochaetes bacterium ADurb.Bin110]
MTIYNEKNEEELGKTAALYGAAAIKRAISQKGYARIILATGASQFSMLANLVKMDIPWDKVTMFHLDEYCDLPITHKASFRKYLQERFVDYTHPQRVYFIDGEGDAIENIKILTDALREEPIDVAFIGIGENGHIAFNDPPADFKTREAYILVNLNDDCKRQQVNEGWFRSIDEVPSRAISMTVYQIMQSKTIICTVPGIRKARAVKATLEAKDPTPLVPASILNHHKDCYLILDEDSASLISV